MLLFACQMGQGGRTVQAQYSTGISRFISVGSSLENYCHFQIIRQYFFPHKFDHCALSVGGKKKKKERKSSYTFQKNVNYSEAELFQTIQKNWSPYQTKLVKMISNIFQATCKGHDPSNGI